MLVLEAWMYLLLLHCHCYWNLENNECTWRNNIAISTLEHWLQGWAPDNSCPLPRDSVIRELLLLCVERSQRRWFGHLVWTFPGCLTGEVRTCSFWKAGPGHAGTITPHGWPKNLSAWASRGGWEERGYPLQLANVPVTQLYLGLNIWRQN